MMGRGEFERGKNDKKEERKSCMKGGQGQDVGQRQQKEEKSEGRRWSQTEQENGVIMSGRKDVACER